MGVARIWRKTVRFTIDSYVNGDSLAQGVNLKFPGPQNSRFQTIYHGALAPIVSDMSTVESFCKTAEALFRNNAKNKHIFLLSAPQKSPPWLASQSNKLIYNVLNSLDEGDK